ncbi:MAG: alpha amylase C-terminal domain-containing protein [Paludibacteraceae bacterium]|nr:alpha amylase C-terminal domain-containing protein [Paludibacteraceae bacterium]
MDKLKLIKKDPYLKPFEDQLYERYMYAQRKEQELTRGSQTLADFATGYLYFGLHKEAKKWVFREWAPNATSIGLIGDFNDWKENDKFQLKKKDNGVWELAVPEKAMKHGDLYKMMVHWEGGCGERIPAWAQRVTQDEQTKVFSAQVWSPEKPYKFKVNKFKPSTSPLLIYETHIGMAGEEECVHTYKEFTQKMLPRISADGYNCIQIMAIQEHPYYGSFGYHVSSFFAASSRFGTPEELKELIDTAHQMGMAVIMDIVHSHAVKNQVEGLGLLDGTPYQYFHDGWRREHNQWDSLCFNYGKNEVMHFLLSNCKYWLDEYHFDGFRFDGVTSMMFLDHGLGSDYGGYDCYFNGNQDGDAICYLTLANRVIHQTNPYAITIAEDVSGMPGLAGKYEDGGIGFDYRLAMGTPDFWIKLIKEQTDEQWKPGSILWMLTNHRAEEKTINYAESHDQALVGDKTIIFRLADADMYWHMSKLMPSSYMVDRAIALHKMIRLITISSINGGYLNFMGNEFGHPEWIDFPREGNGWSYKYARRQWSLVDNKDLKYCWLGDWDKDMITLVKSMHRFNELPISVLWEKADDQVIAYQRGDLIFVFNFHPNKSYTDYGMLVEPGEYKVVLNSDNSKYGGFNLIDEGISHFTLDNQESNVPGKKWLQVYLPSRCCFVLKKVK